MEIVTYVDNLWILIAGILVMFMQPGFMLVETGFTRSKNSVNIVMKNFMDFSVGALTYCLSLRELNLVHIYFSNPLYAD